MQPEDRIERRCDQCHRATFPYDHPRPHVCLCHFCGRELSSGAEQLEDVVMARCKLCEPFRQAADGDVAFCLECGRDRRISRAPRIINQRELAGLTHFHHLLPQVAGVATLCAEAPTNRCCCDGQRLIQLLEAEIPALATELGSGNRWVYGRHTVREHAHHIAHRYLTEGFGQAHPEGLKALSVALLVLRAVSWQIAESEGSPQHFCVIAAKLFETYRSELETIYANESTEERERNDLLLEFVPGDVGKFLDLAASLIAEDPLRKYLQGHHVERAYARSTGKDEKRNKTHEGEHGRITLEDAVERVRDMAEKAGLDDPRQAFSVHMAVFLTEMAAYPQDQGTQAAPAGDAAGFSVEDAYMVYHPDFFTYLWGRVDGAPRFTAGPPPDYPLQPEPAARLKTVQYLCADAPEGADEESADTQEQASPEPAPESEAPPRRDSEELAEFERLLSEAREGLRKSSHFVKPMQSRAEAGDGEDEEAACAGTDPVTENQYNFLRSVVVYESEVPGSRLFEQPRDPRIDKLLHYGEPPLLDPTVGGEDDLFIEALTDLPCADEVVYFICRYFDALFDFPNAAAATPQELLHRVLDYLYRCPITITFNIHQWFMPWDGPDIDYPARHWPEYKACFLLPQAENPIASVIGGLELTGDEQAVYDEEGRRRALITLEKSRQLTVEETTELEGITARRDALAQHQRDRITTAWNRRGEELRTYTMKADYTHQREGQYNRWRREKDERIVEYRNFKPDELPIYTFLNPDWDASHGHIGPRSLGSEYFYYGTGQFVLADSIRRRCVYKIRSKDAARRNLLLVVADLVNYMKNGFGRDKKLATPILFTIIGNAVAEADARLAVFRDDSAETTIEAICLGKIRFTEDVERLQLPSELPQARYDAMRDGTIPVDDLRILATACNSVFASRPNLPGDFEQWWRIFHGVARANWVEQVKDLWPAAPMIPIQLLAAALDAMGCDHARRFLSDLRGNVDLLAARLLILARVLDRNQLGLLLGYMPGAYRPCVDDFSQTHDIAIELVDPWFDAPCDFKPNLADRYVVDIAADGAGDKVPLPVNTEETDPPPREPVEHHQEFAPPT